MKQRDRYFDFSKGLQTTGYDRSGEPDEFDVFQDVETDFGVAEARKGKVLLRLFTHATNIMAFDGVNDRVDFPAELALNTVLGTRWTVEILFKTTSVAANHYLIGSATGACGLTIRHTTSSTVVVVVTDSAAAASTLTFTGVAAGTLCGLQVTRDGATVAGYLNGDTQTTTMSATTLLATGAISAGTDNGASWHLGAIDTFRGWSVARTTRADLYSRRMTPRHRDCLWDFCFETGTGGDILDRGRNQYHATTAGSPAFNATLLANNPAPVQGLAYNVRKNGTREIVAVVAGTVQTAAVT